MGKTDEISRIGKHTETKSRIKIIKGLKRGEWELLSNGYRIFIWDDEIF